MRTLNQKEFKDDTKSLINDCKKLCWSDQIEKIKIITSLAYIVCGWNLVIPTVICIKAKA